MNLYLWSIVFISYLIVFYKRNKFSLQNQLEYNNFADKRQFSCGCCKINNFNDVISNIVYFIGGLYQLFILNNTFLGYSSILVAFGSIYYHLKPNMFSLFYDRLPMQIAFSSIIFDRINLNMYDKFLMYIYIYGSLLYWKYTFDLKLYASFQISLILYLILFNTDMYIPVLCYIFAKICEDLDKYIYSKTNIISGHTLKHIISGIALFFI